MIEHKLSQARPTVCNSLTLSEMFTSLRKVLLLMFDCPVIQGSQNRSAIPKGSFIVMNSLLFEEQSTNRVSYEQYSAFEGQEVHQRTTFWQVQVDCYGDEAEIMAQTISTLIRSDWGCQAFKSTGYDIAPIHASTPRQANFIDSEQQYGGRYSVTLHFNPVIKVGVPVSFFNAANIRAASTQEYYSAYERNA